jgi:hypothetical protein
MNGDDSDRQAVDRLVGALLADGQARSNHGPGGGSAPAARPGEPRPGSRWTHVRLQMPARRGPGPWQRLASASASAISLPQIPDLTRFFRLPGPVTMVRLWVGLAAVHSAAMNFWPYPKTYLWGLVAYLLSLGLGLVAGVWGARLSWDARLGAAHTVALGASVWAVTLAAAVALPLA